MKRFRTYVALTLVFLFVPGTLAAAENLVHLVAHGALAHSSHGDSHQDSGSEHDCSGLFHTCLCHSTLLVTGPSAGAPLPAPRSHSGRHLIIRNDRTASGYPDTLYRPPIV